MKSMSEATNANVMFTRVTRVEISADDWTEIRKIALDENTTMPKLIGSLLRELIEQRKVTA